MERILHCRIRAVDLDRRGFLGLGMGAGIAAKLRAQAPPVAAMPAPARAKITSMAMLWTLPGKFSDRVRIAALAGMQSVGLTDECAGWSDAEFKEARRHIESFGMIAGTVGATAGALTDAAQASKAIAAAKRMESPYVLFASDKEQAVPSVGGARELSALASAAEITLLLPFTADSLRLVKEVDQPALRMTFSVYDEQARSGSVMPAQREALEFTELMRIADGPGRGEPGTGKIDFKEVYRALQKGGYSHVVAMEYTPKGDAVASLKRAVDRFRAAINERVTPASATEGSFV